MRLQDPLSRLEGVGGRVGAARDLGLCLPPSRELSEGGSHGTNGTLQDSLTCHSLGAIVLYPLLAPLTGAELAILLPSEAALESTQPG